MVNQRQLGQVQIKIRENCMFKCRENISWLLNFDGQLEGMRPFNFLYKSSITKKINKIIEITQNLALGFVWVGRR